MKLDRELCLTLIALVLAAIGIVWQIIRLTKKSIDHLISRAEGKVPEQRGFEVKLNSGREPETKKKEEKQ